MATVEENLKILWEAVVPVGPQLAFHTCCVLRQCLYIHGGITVYGNKTPSNKLYKMDLSERIWREVFSPGSPALSHHACVPLSDRYMLIIGGWNGKSRSGKLFIFDIEADSWKVPEQSGFPENAGLSSHTATRLANGDIMILGREGSLRTQRRSGTAYILMGTVEKGFKFNEYSRSITSRSGHTTDIVGTKMYVTGGRSDNFLELQGGFLNGSTQNASILAEVMKKGKLCHKMTKIPCGRRHHVSMSGPEVIFLHGGETFNGRSREPVGEMFLLTLKPEVNFLKLPGCSIKRAGHICFTNGKDVFIHGGLSGKSTICGDTQRLVV